MASSCGFLGKRVPVACTVGGNDALVNVEVRFVGVHLQFYEHHFQVQVGEVFAFLAHELAGGAVCVLSWWRQFGVDVGKALGDEFELLESLFGIRTIASGQILVGGKKMRFSSSKDAMNHSFALVTEERKLNGMFGKDTIRFNTTITNLDAYKTFHLLDNKKLYDAANREIKQMNTKCVSSEELITALSGGNQQKVIIGKWMERSPQIFLMDEPTRGIDVGAKYEIYQLIIRMAKEGKTIVVVSSEMPEILGITNRIAVMSNHRLAGIVNTQETNQEELLRLSAKYL